MPDSMNLLRSAFYICPLCGTSIHATKGSSVTCCDEHLAPLQMQEPEGEHEIMVERIDGRRYVHLDHPMTKDHSIRWIALLTDDRLEMQQLYPEQDANASFTMHGHGLILTFCDVHGLHGMRH